MFAGGWRDCQTKGTEVAKQAAWSEALAQSGLVAGSKQFYMANFPKQNIRVSVQGTGGLLEFLTVRILSGS